MPSDLIRGWVPVRVKKTRQNKRLEPPFRFNRNGKGSGVDEKAVYGALIRHGSVLSTSVNPTDGLRFDGGAKVPPRVALIRYVIARYVIAADGRRQGVGNGRTGTPGDT